MWPNYGGAFSSIIGSRISGSEFHLWSIIEVTFHIIYKYFVYVNHYFFYNRGLASSCGRAHQLLRFRPSTSCRGHRVGNQHRMGILMMITETRATMEIRGLVREVVPVCAYYVAPLAQPR